MGAIGGLLGVSGGVNGTGIGGPTTKLDDPTGSQNLEATYNQLQGVANGTGPNPAMAQYNQNVQNLAKQQAGAISSIQGISPALAARMASQQGSGAMQNAAAAGANTQAEQQLGAMGQMGQVGNSQAQIAEGLQQNANSVNGQLANTSMQGQQGVTGGILQGVGAALGLADGGMVPRFAGGGSADPFSFGSPQSHLGNFMSASAPPMQAMTGPSALQSGMSGLITGIGKAIKGTPGTPAGPDTSAIGDYAPGGNDIYSSPNMGASMMNMHSGMGAGHYLDSFPAQFSSSLMAQPTGMLAKGGSVGSKLKSGGKVPGKPKFAGNNYANDVVSAKLSPGEVVIPNNVMQSKDPVRGAAEFVRAIMAKRGRK
jgi:hypothetical protein